MNHAAMTIAALLAAWLAVGLARAGRLPWIGRVSRVVDGDSVEAVLFGTVRRIRLHGVDAPEWTQPHGREAWIAMRALVEGRRVLFLPLARDRYGRILCGLVTRGGVVAWSLALHGHAWPETAATGVIHVPARLLRRGLWADRLRMPPDAWRRFNPSRRRRA